MSLTNRQQRELFESAIAAVNTPQKETPVEVEESAEISTENTESIDKIETIVMDYINNAISNSVNESTSEEDLETEIVEAVHNLNVLCSLVNEYFNYEG